MWSTIPGRLLIALLLGLSFFVRAGGAAEPSKLILALGDDSYISSEEVKGWTGAEVKEELGDHDLLEFAVVILSNIPYGELPAAVREGLPGFVREGGSVLITGGPNAYGSGGYRAIQHLLPFQIRADQDWVAMPFKPIIPVDTGHPIFAGVTLSTVGSFNDVSLKRGAREIAFYAGGGIAPGAGRSGSGAPIGGARPGGARPGASRPGGARPGASRPGAPGPAAPEFEVDFARPSLIAEHTEDRGTVLGIAFDLGREMSSSWRDSRKLFRNALVYLTERSPLTPKEQKE
ncbi:MAG: hypothetical protein ACE5I9_04545 [Candidatus Methylomirabilales bacterium]